MIRRRRDDIDGGWAWVVLIAVYAGIFIISTSTFMGGIIYLALLDRFRDDEAKTALVVGLNTGLLSLFGPVASVVITTFSCRTSIMIAGILTTSAYLSSAYVRSIGLLIVTYGVIGGIGNAFAGSSFPVVLGYYFEKRRNLMISLAFAFIGTGMFAASPLASFILDAYGMSGALHILGALNAHLCVVGMICHPSRIEKDLKVQTRKRRQELREKNWITALKKYINLDLLTNVKFMMFLCSTSTWNLTLSVCFLHLPNYLHLQGASEGNINSVMELFSIANTAGRILGASIVDKSGLDAMTIHLGTMGVGGLVAILFPTYGSLTGAEKAFAILVGLYTGSPNAIMTPILISLVGVDHLSQAFGLASFFCGIGFCLGPPFAGLLLKHTQSYTWSFTLAGTAMLIGSLLGMFSSCTGSGSKETSSLPKIGDESVDHDHNNWTDLDLSSSKVREEVCISLK
ncbi:hypothetical protein CHS0354_033995 [Potamilus streckersoni]|uniref:Major facilitator superfamily (MFS) profile domain-containing protein n=1 Tax=Potamilus streckersoni TaxID=2493646 RepID=A0AAE0W8W7_9BIVA|nr:hypothetical protein CHS0354_033995 [Potamilus streckersoni]